MQQCDQFIELLEEHSRAKRPRLSIGNRQSLIAKLARLEGSKNRLEQRFLHLGGDYVSSGNNNNNTMRFFWREIDIAFNSRILTGAVINTNYIEPRQFLEDAGSIVLEHVRNIMNRHNSVKVNTIFNCEFVTGDKRANKSINTKNYKLFKTSTRMVRAVHH